MAATTDDIPQMDYAEHERTFRGFTRFTEIAIVHVLCLVLVITIWGVKHSGGWALFGFILDARDDDRRRLLSGSFLAPAGTACLCCCSSSSPCCEASMIIATTCEDRAAEPRVAITPETARKLAGARRDGEGRGGGGIGIGLHRQGL